MIIISHSNLKHNQKTIILQAMIILKKNYNLKVQYPQIRYIKVHRL